MGEDLFPTSVTIPTEELERDFVRLQHGLAPDPRCHFSLALSRAWKTPETELTAPSEDVPEARVGLLYRAEAPQAECEVRVQSLDRELHPADFLQCWLEEHGHEVDAFRAVPSDFGLVGDSASSAEVAGHPVMFRTLCLKDGCRYFVVSLRCGQPDYPALAQELFMALQSFELTNPTGQMYAEPMEVYPFKRPLAGAFAFPAAWEHRADLDAPDEMSAMTMRHMAGDELIGQFTFAAVPQAYEADHRGLLGAYLEQVTGDGIDLESGEVQPVVPPHEAFDACWSGVLPAVRGQEKLELRCTILHVTNVAWLLAAMIGPAREADALVQMANRRAHDIAVETLEVDRS